MPVNSSDLDIVGIFPALDSGVYGGIQAAGREAWRGIVDRTGGQSAHALQYESGTSKTGAIFRAVTTRRRAKLILVWHVQLLKLLPFLDRSACRVAVVLHGIEAWVKHDLITRWLLRKANLLLADSNHTWTQFLDRNPTFADAQHQIVYLGLGSRLETPTPRPDDRPAVLMIGRLDKREDYKGHRQMISAWPLVLERLNDAQLWIVGDGNLRPSLEKLAAQRVPGGLISFHGRVSDLEKERLIARCRCLALPSRSEGFGLVYLEAMRMGRPCLVSTFDAGREVVNPPEAGLAVDPDNPREIADAVHRMLTSESEWEQWAMRARARYEAHFTGDHFRHRFVSAIFQN